MSYTPPTGNDITFILPKGNWHAQREIDNSGLVFAIDTPWMYEPGTGVTVSLNTLSLSNSAQNTVLVPGAKSVGLNSISANATAAQSSWSGSVTVALNNIQSSVAVQATDILPGIAVVPFTAISLLESIQNVSFSTPPPASQTVDLNSVSLSALINNLTLNIGGVQTTLDLTSVTSAILTIDTNTGPITVTIDSLILNSILRQIQVDIRTRVQLNAITFNNSLETLSIQAGSATSLLSPLTLAAIARMVIRPLPSIVYSFNLRAIDIQVRGEQQNTFLTSSLIDKEFEMEAHDTSFAHTRTLMAESIEERTTVFSVDKICTSFTLNEVERVFEDEEDTEFIRDRLN